MYLYSMDFILNLAFTIGLGIAVLALGLGLIIWKIYQQYQQ